MAVMLGRFGAVGGKSGVKRRLYGGVERAHNVTLVCGPYTSTQWSFVNGKTFG